MGILVSKFEWKEFLADVVEFAKTELLPIEVLRAFFLFLADNLHAWIFGTFDLKVFLEGLSQWARANLTKQGVMKLSAIVEKRLIFSGTLGPLAEMADGTLLDQLFEKGYDTFFPTPPTS